MERCLAPCAECVQHTLHDILYSITTNNKYSRPGSAQRSELLQCGGCGHVSMACTYIEDDDEETYYYPPSTLRVPFQWPFKFYLSGKLKDLPAELLHEIYQAVAGGQYQLAVMGIRSLLEQIMIAQIGDHGRFSENLERFHRAGHLSLVQRNALATLLEAGHAVTHRSFRPDKHDLNTLLDILEGTLGAIYRDPDAAEALQKRVPPRAPRLGARKK